MYFSGIYGSFLSPVFFVYFTDPEPCKRLGLECVSCSQCGENGFCITNLDLRNSNMVCLCRYGFTGNQAKFVPQRLETTTYTKNRIRADSCDVKCNYSPHNRYKMFYLRSQKIACFNDYLTTPHPSNVAFTSITAFYKTK